MRPVERPSATSAPPVSQNTSERRRLDHAVNALSRRSPVLSARSLLSRGQVAALMLLAVALPAVAFTSPAALRPALLAALGLPFFCITLLRLWALWHYLTRRRVVVPRDARQVRSHPQPADTQLPAYSILVPLYREARVVPDLLAALARLDYPAARMEILLIMEEHDAATRDALMRAGLAANMRILTVPGGIPRTKPRALNYALTFARGKYVAVYDAEDAPEPGQLKMAVRAFRTRPGRIGCVQARLDIYTPASNFFTRQFTLEYMALFYGLLPAYQRAGIPLPLGGTSNHFPRAVLEEAGGWDPYNVTEDADLGLRLARKGYGVAMIGSTTWEEAPQTLRQWFGQRTRWIKGWMQTYCVHTRQPLHLCRELGLRACLGFHLVFGGLILSALVHPLFYAILAAQVLNGEGAFAAGNPVEAAVWTACLFNVAASYLTSMALAVAVCIRRGRVRLALSAVWLPFYWLLFSLAAYAALLDLARRPHHWSKTLHTGAGRSRIDAAGRCRPAGKRPSSP